MIRREFLKKSLTAVGLAALSRYGLYPPQKAWANTSDNPFINKLFIPPLLEHADDGQALFSLNAQKGHQDFFNGVTTETLGYNGSFLGPTIRVHEGDKVRFRVKNHLDQPTTVHWHGLHVPAEWDGGPHQPIEPGEIWKPEFTIRQQAATLWYHPHAMGLTGEHVYRGLAGLFIIEDDISESLPLPNEYGYNDIPLILQDRRYYEDGSFAYVRSMHDIMHGVMGNYMLVNGVMKPHLEVRPEVVRFRLLNGSNSSIYRLQFSGEETFHAIASDGGFLSRPVPLKDVILSSGERLEFLVDFSSYAPGDKIRLVVDQFNGNRFEVMEIRIVQGAARVARLVTDLRDQPVISETIADNTRYFSMETMSARGRGMMGGNRLTINGKKMDMKRIDETIRLGTTEIWELENRSASMMQLPHSMHLHDVQFNILDRNGKPPVPVEAGRKDTVLLWPNDKVRIIARFLDYTGIYMYHCHMLEHEDDGMMGQFEVVDMGMQV